MWTNILIRCVGMGLALAVSMLPALAQYTAGSSGIHGVFPPLPEGETTIPANASSVVWNVRTGAVLYCNGYSSSGPTPVLTCSSAGATIATAQIPGIPKGGLTTGVYHFTSFTAPSGRTVYIVGDSYIPPVSILSQTDITISGTLDGNGCEGGYPLQSFAAGVGGCGGPGASPGGFGGNGGDAAQNGNPGFGPAGGAGGVNTGTAGELRGSPPGSSPSTLALTPLIGGSGGGGGAGVPPDSSQGCGAAVLGYGGAGAGGGGGAILLAAEQNVVLNGTVNAFGGPGRYNTSLGGVCSGLEGAGGEGGSVRIVARNISGSGAVNVLGGASGWQGTRSPGGRFRIEAFTNTFGGSISGTTRASFIAFPLAPIPLNLPTLTISTISGVAVPANPQNDLAAPDVNLPTAPPNPAVIGLAATNVPLGTMANVRVTPRLGTFNTTMSNGFSGTVGNSSATASVTLPPGYGSIHAIATFDVTATALEAIGLRDLPLAPGEDAASIEVVAQAGLESTVFLLTSTGRRFELTSGGGLLLR